MSRTALALVLLALVAVTARAPRLTTRDLWTDEMHTLRIARTGEYSHGPAYKTAPINFIVTSWVGRAVGFNELGGRAFPFTAGVMTVLLLYYLGRRWVGARAAFLAALVLALSAWHVSWSQTARHFAPQMLAILLALHNFLRFWRARETAGIVLAPLFFLLALFTHSSAGSYVVGVLAFVVWDWMNGVWRAARAGTAFVGTRHWQALGSLGLLLLVYSPIILIVGRAASTAAAPWNPLWNILGSFAYYVPPWLAFPAVAGAFVLWKERDSLAVLLPLLVVIPLGLVLVGATITTASASYCLASLLGVALLVGVGLDRLIRHAPDPLATRLTVILAAGVFVAQLAELGLYHTFYNGYKPRWRSVADYIREHRSPGEVVVASEADVLEFYLADEPNVIWMEQFQEQLTGAALADGLDPAARRAVSAGGWFALYWEDGLLPLPPEVRQFILSSASFQGLFLAHYGPKDRTIAVFHVTRPKGARTIAGPVSR